MRTYSSYQQTRCIIIAQKSKKTPFIFFVRYVVVKSQTCIFGYKDCSRSGSSCLYYLRVFSNSCPLSWWWYLTISSSATPFFCLQSFPASGSFTMSWLFASGGQSIGASASVLSVNIQGWFPLGLTGWLFLQSKGLSRVFSSTTVLKYQIFSAQSSL